MAASELRSQFLRYNPFRSRVVEVTIPSPEGEPAVVLKVKIKQPSVQERQAIFADAKVSRNGEITTNNARTGALAIIQCARDPDTDAPIFEGSDLDSILASPAGGWVDFLSAKVMEVLVEANDLAKK